MTNREYFLVRIWCSVTATRK